MTRALLQNPDSVWPNEAMSALVAPATPLDTDEHAELQQFRARCVAASRVFGEVNYEHA